jgi:uncharacterized NAD(P)/FAD-binding protein YdhS
MRRVFVPAGIEACADDDAGQGSPDANGATVVRASIASDLAAPTLTVAIAGGGASGSLLAVELVSRSPGVRVVVFEPRELLGPGTAYATACPAHLLNVPAAHMSAFAGEPDGFVTWLAAHHPGTYGPQSFVPRALYGDYLAAVVARARQSAGPRVEHVRAAATQVDVDGTRLSVASSTGRAIRADVLVLASGNAFPAPWPGIGADLGESRFFASAWDERALQPEDRNETVLLLGTGLTAVDAVLGLRHNGHRGRLYMVSRRGLLPSEHRFFDSPPAAKPDAAGMTDLLDAARKLARGASGESVDWRASIDRMRPRTNALWQAMSLEDQRRFVRHALPYWNVHRHRMAPEAANALAGLMAADELRMLAGYTRAISVVAGRFAVTIELRGNRGVTELAADRIINCSGPEHDVRKLDNPLLRNLLTAGLLQPHALGVGVDVAENGALRDRDGRDSERLFTLGPIRYGTLIETTAIPEIRVQVRDLATLLLERIGTPART